MIKYSVIIPVYNSEKTIARCLDSLLVQNRMDVQIIAVDDGSSDQSGNILRAYMDRYCQVTCIFQENAGVSCARNRGLDIAQGKYITFVDSDDYVRSDYFEVLDDHGDEDLLVFCHEVIGEEPRNMPALFEELNNLETAEERLKLLLHSRRIMSPWDKRFKKSIVEKYHIRFPEGMQIGEDFNFSLHYAVCSREIVVEKNQIIYNDITDNTSLSRKYRPHLDQQMYDAFTMVADTVRNSEKPPLQKNELLTILDYVYVKHVFSCISEEFKQKKLRYMRDRERIAEICQMFQGALSAGRCNTIHRAIRIALRCRMYGLFYWVCYWLKGRKYSA